MGVMTEDRERYTSDVINEAHTATAAEVSANNFKLNWAPIGAIKQLKIGDTTYAIVAAGSEVADTSVSVNTADGTVTFASGDTNFVAEASVKVLYTYDNVIIPQEKLPTLTANMDVVELYAHARRIAVYYSQIAAFQSKTDYGTDIGEQLAAQAQGELTYKLFVA